MFITLSCLIPLVLLEFLTIRNKRSNKLIYNIAFFIVLFIVSIKYYYGPDIALYIPTYNNIEDTFSYKTDLHIEPGFSIFCLILKKLGVSYWGMTFIVTILYFTAIRILFSSLTKYRTLALTALVTFDYNLMFFELRQSLAVSFFIFAFLCARKNKDIPMILALILTSLLHKSGIFFSFILFIVVYSKKVKIESYSYLIPIVLLFVIQLLPFTKALPALNLPPNVISSIEHHLTLGKNLQFILPIYLLMFIILLTDKKNGADDNKWIGLFVFISVLFIAVFYKYWFLLNRLRSYFIPMLIVYIFNILADERCSKYLKQTFITLLFLYTVKTTLNLYVSENKSYSKINRAQTIFILKDKTEDEVVKESLKRAESFWKNEYILQ
ncbi:MAG: EpsG family protein [Paludibacteraceae bacterium]|nr:EpsG family protein [Paludibacteraceae bacterium]